MRTGKYTKPANETAQIKNERREFATMEVRSEPIQTKAHSREEVSLSPQPKVSEEKIMITERNKVLEMLLCENVFKTDVTMTAMKEHWAFDRRLSGNGMIDNLQIPDGPFIRYETHYLCFVPRNQHYIFKAKLKDILPA